MVIQSIEERLLELEREIGLVPSAGNPLGGGLSSVFAPFRTDVSLLETRISKIEKDAVSFARRVDILATPRPPLARRIARWLADLLHRI